MRHFYKYEIVVHVHPFKKEEDSPPLTFTVHLFMTQGQRLMETFCKFIIILINQQVNE